MYHILFALSTKIAKKCSFICFPYLLVVRILFRLYLGCLPQQTNSLIFVESFNRYRVVLWITCFCFPYWRQIKPYRRALPCKTRAIPHNSKCRYGERGAADAKPKAQIILDAAKVSAASGGYSEPKQGQRSQSARGFCPRSTMRVAQPNIIEHFGNADAVPQPPERCLSRQAGIVRCCLKSFLSCVVFYR